MIEAKWSGSYPCLCIGKWTLIVDGEDVSEKIPEELRNTDMGTFGTYSSWHFEDWMEVFNDYVDGSVCEDWINENKYWLKTITSDESIYPGIFDAINKEDFRSGSCGGCI